MVHTCPLDRTELSPQDHFGVGALSCPRCEGCWVPEKGVRDVFAKLPGADARYDRFCEHVAHEGRKSGHACGDCGEAMFAIHRRGVELDVCSGCGGIWFDGGELRGFLSGSGSGSRLAAGAAGVAALGAAGLSAAAPPAPAQQQNGESPLTAAADIAVDAASSGGIEVVGDIVGGAFSLLGDLFSGL